MKRLLLLLLCLPLVAGAQFEERIEKHNRWLAQHAPGYRAELDSTIKAAHEQFLTGPRPSCEYVHYKTDTLFVVVEASYLDKLEARLDSLELKLARAHVVVVDTVYPDSAGGGLHRHYEISFDPEGK